jgi:hypothetical protein
VARSGLSNFNTIPNLLEETPFLLLEGPECAFLSSSRLGFLLPETLGILTKRIRAEIEILSLINRYEKLIKIKRRCLW